MTGPDPAWDPWTDQSYLRESQYKTDVNLAARQSIYAYQQPRIDLARETLELGGHARPWAAWALDREFRARRPPAAAAARS